MADVASAAAVIGPLCLPTTASDALLVTGEWIVLAVAWVAVSRGARWLGPRLGRRIALRPVAYLTWFVGLGVVLSMLLGSVISGLAVAALATASIAAAADA